MAKGMGNGFPIGAISIAPHLHPKHGMLGTTFGGNQLACAAAIAVLEVIEMEGLIENAATTGDYLMQSLREIPELKNVRGRGLMIGFDMPDSHIDLRKKLLTDHFIFTGEAKPNVIRLLPSLALNRGEADEFLEAVRKEISVPVG
jgi:acetylornithine aminotransferase